MSDYLDNFPFDFYFNVYIENYSFVDVYSGRICLRRNLSGVGLRIPQGMEKI